MASNNQLYTLVYVMLLLLGHITDKERQQDQSSTVTLSGTCTLIEIYLFA